MKKGKMYHPPPRYVVPIHDINFFGDGCLWTVYVLEEDLEWINGYRYVRTNARVVNIVRQTPLNMFTEVRIRDSDLKKLKVKYEHKRGGLE